MITAPSQLLTQRYNQSGGYLACSSLVLYAIKNQRTAINSVPEPVVGVLGARAGFLWHRAGASNSSDLILDIEVDQSDYNQSGTNVFR